MKFFINKKVRITLSNGMGIEGVVVQWDEDAVIITYLDNNNFTTILNPSKNIMMVSVFNSSYEKEEKPEQSLINVKEEKSKPAKKPPVQVKRIEKPVPAKKTPVQVKRIEEPADLEKVELDHFEPDPTMRAVKLAELYLQKNKAIKEQLRCRFKKEFTPATLGTVRYETPTFKK